MQVKKRDGRIMDFDKHKITDAVVSAMKEVNHINERTAKRIANEISHSEKDILTIEEIQDMVEEKLMASSFKDVAKAYIIYREDRTRARGNTTDATIQEIVTNSSEYWSTENSNKNPQVVTTQRDYMAGATSTDLSRRKLLPKDIVMAHDEGIIHFHDIDYFAQNALTNCELVNLEDMLMNGTVINGVKIDPPHRILTASTIATQIILAVTSSTYGGCTVSLTHLAPFVRMSYNRYKEKYLSWHIDEEDAQIYALRDTQKEVEDAVQTFNYQVNSMTNTNGQAPFLSVNMYLGETEEYKDEVAMLIKEFLLQRIRGFKNEKGVWVTPAFPKLLYVLEEDNIHPDSKYYSLTELAAKCTAKRLVPDYISEKIMKQLKNGDCYPCMGCRSFLTPDRFSDKHQYYGRFNQGVVTINLPDIALSANKDAATFWKLFEERTELCHKALKLRHERIAGITSDAAPILWQHGAFARLEKGQSVHELLHGGYSTLSLGYAGLYECVKEMTGYSHTDEHGKEFAIQVMQALNDKCNQWKREEDIDYSLYGSPIESTTYKFAKCLDKRFGERWQELGEDRDYITNSYHVNVREKISAFDKLKFEAEFQALSPGGAISYVEVPNLQDNLPAVLSIITYIYDNIMYAELNTKSDYCQVCDYDGEIQIIKDNDKLIWECPCCGNRDQNKMSVARRTCGYIGSQFWNQGRTEEIKDRFVHVSIDNF